MTLLELMMACAILLILATAAMPVARFTVQRQKETELRRNLREIRDAIDRYKDAADRNLIRVEAGTEGYPPDLETLVTGVDLSGPASAGLSGAAGVVTGQSGSALTPFGSSMPAFGSQAASASRAGTDLIRHVRFLRRIPRDPMTGRAEWGRRAVADDPDSTSWGGENVFDVFSLSSGMGLDGTRYQDW